MRIPEDIAIVGFDDVPASANTDPPLTTVRQPSHQMGVIAAEIFIDVLEQGEMYMHRVILPTELIIRESCGATRQYGNANATLMQINIIGYDLCTFYR